MPQETLSDTRVGLNSDKIDERNTEMALFRYVSRQDDKKAILREPRMKETRQSSIPAGTYGPAMAMRKRILQLSLAPHITSNPRLKVEAPSRLG
jgi:hypothetical protein